MKKNRKMQKKERIPKRVSLPDALLKKDFLDIVLDIDALSVVSKVRPTLSYSMGQLYINFSETFGNMPAMLVVSHPNRLPTWDEIVWIRYHICPEIEDMGLILPSLDHYINFDSGRQKYTMTLEDLTIRRLMR